MEEVPAYVERCDFCGGGRSQGGGGKVISALNAFVAARVEAEAANADTDSDESDRVTRRAAGGSHAPPAPFLRRGLAAE